MAALRVEWRLLLLAVALQLVSGRAVRENVNDNVNKDETQNQYDGILEMNDEELQKVIQKYLHYEEYQKLRQVLTLLGKIVENDATSTDENGGNVEEYMTSSDMPFYFDRIRSIINGDVTRPTRRRHHKRSTFDSISHQGGFVGFGNTYRKQKLEFTFENLLPFLLEEMRRNNKGVSGTY